MTVYDFPHYRSDQDPDGRIRHWVGPDEVDLRNHLHPNGIKVMFWNEKDQYWAPCNVTGMGRNDARCYFDEYPYRDHDRPAHVRVQKPLRDAILPGGPEQGILYMVLTFFGLVWVIAGTQNMPAWWTVVLLLVVGGIGGGLTALAFKFPRVFQAMAYAMAAVAVGRAVHRHHQHQQANMIADAINRRS